MTRPQPGPVTGSNRPVATNAYDPTVPAQMPGYPPPPPSARRTATAPFPSADAVQYPPPLGVPAQTMEALPVEETPVDAEANPFRKAIQWRKLLKLKRPSREVLIRAGVAVLALTLGWGIGAKPWKKSEPARAAIARTAKRTAPRAHVANRRVAAVNHTAAPTAPKARTTSATSRKATHTAAKTTKHTATTATHSQTKKAR